MKSHLQITTLTVGQMAANCYIVSDPGSGEGIVIDPGDDPEYISDTLLRLKITPTRIIATHGHFDHIMGVFAIKLGFSIPFYIHGSDAFLVGRMAETARHFLGLPVVDPAPVIDGNLNGNELVAVGNAAITVVHLPGHTPGSIGLYDKEAGTLFCGDTIFAGGSIGRSDHTYSSETDLRTSIGKILRLPEKTLLLSGHGEQSTVGAESRYHVQ